MRSSLENAIKWGKVNVVFGIISGIFAFPLGIILIIGYLKLNEATKIVAEMSEKVSNSPEEYEVLVSKYGEYLKFIGIMNLLSVLFGLIGILIYIAIFAGLMGMNASMIK